MVNHRIRRGMALILTVSARGDRAPRAPACHSVRGSSCSTSTPTQSSGDLRRRPRFGWPCPPLKNADKFMQRVNGNAVYLYQT